MSQAHDRRTDEVSGLSRRRILAGSAAAVGGFGAAVGGFRTAVGPVTGQLTFPALVPEPDRWTDANFAGFMIHVGGKTDPADLDADAGCDLEGWPPEQTLAYDATLINRKQSDTPEEDIVLYTGDDEDVPSGALFLVNTFERCEADYVGVNLEQIGRYDVGGSGEDQATDYGPVADVEEDERPNEGTEDGGAVDAFGPGFGVVGSVAGLLGGGVYLRWRRD